MTKFVHWRTLAGLVFGLALTTTGCQTWLGGMTLPSPDYLKDNPDYIPHQPVFKLPNELSAMQAGQAAAPLQPGGAGRVGP
jgi:hypothetical protein